MVKRKAEKQCRITNQQENSQLTYSQKRDKRKHSFPIAGTEGGSGGPLGWAVTRLGRTRLQGSWQSGRPQGTELLAPRGRSQAGPRGMGESLSGGHGRAGLLQSHTTHRGPQRGREPHCIHDTAAGAVWAGTRAVLRACASASVRCPLPSRSPSG